MERPFILHMFTPSRQMSPFDVNMAVDAGYQVVVPYADVGIDNIAALTQDAIFSRGPKGVAHTGLFIGGRDVVLAADMLLRAREAMVPPFEVSVFADPSGAYTTAAALVAGVERHLRRSHGTDFEGKRIVVLGGTGPVGVIAGVLAARAGALVSIASSRGLEAAQAASSRINARFNVQTRGADAQSNEALDITLSRAEVVFSTAAAGVQVMNTRQVDQASQLLAAADVNAVPPAGIAGVGVADDGKPFGLHRALGIGALAIGNVKYQVQRRLFERMLASGKPLYLGFEEAFALAREVVAECEAQAV
ncbi:NAD(P)-dependent methylenetetrahydromethanopterin dehydrogenase [Paraburkholderia sp. JHI2823]|uniref:NAD(P)-dependent methylenetetrahydromethanopterin dehydrogenase n=1 Tax=Paraburkholderia TaxID=1822464 RepID=UPI00316B4960